MVPGVSINDDGFRTSFDNNLLARSLQNQKDRIISAASGSGVRIGDIIYDKDMLANLCCYFS